jgi:hypothetical protein
MKKYFLIIAVFASTISLKAQKIDLNQQIKNAWTGKAAGKTKQFENRSSLP